MNTGLKEKNAIVAGGAGDLGFACCVELIEQGANVLIADINEERVNSRVGDLRKLASSQAAGVVIDVTNRASVKKMVLACNEKFGNIDIFINTIGIPHVSLLLKTETGQDWDADWAKVMDINAKGVFICCQEVINNMISSSTRGTIVNFSAIAGVKPHPLLGIYGASKATVNALTEAFALESAPFGIRVNAICPGGVDNEFNRKASENRRKLLGISEEEYQRSKLKSTPLGRRATALDMANAALFLSSELSSFITGQCLVVAGGK